jgi:hypothetical protein
MLVVLPVVVVAAAVVSVLAMAEAEAVARMLEEILMRRCLRRRRNG